MKKEEEKNKKKVTKKKETKPAVKKTNARKKVNKKKGFTLIELLAVIIILGVLMIIAIPSVTTYIQNSRKNAYIDTAKNIVGAARNLVNSGKIQTYDKTAVYYISEKCLSTENGSQSPFGEFKAAYVGVIYSGDGYKYYWASVDSAGQGIGDVTPADKLDIDLINSDLDSFEVEEKVFNTGIGGRRNVLVLDEDCRSWNQMTSNPNNPIEEDGTVSEFIYTVSAIIRPNQSVGEMEYSYGSAEEAINAINTFTGHDEISFYLKHKIKDGIIVSSSIELYISPQAAQMYSGLKAGSYSLMYGSSYYEQNKETILRAFGNEHCSDYENIETYCHVSPVSSTVSTYGNINVFSDNSFDHWQCHVYRDSIDCNNLL